MRRFLIVYLMAASIVVASAASAAAPSSPVPIERVWDQHGRLVWERGVAAEDHSLAYEKHVRYADIGADGQAAKPDKPDKPDKPGKPGGGGPGTDCRASQYRLTGYHWKTTYAGYTTGYTAAFNAAAQSWDNATGAGLFGGFAAGSMGVAGELDGVNQIDFVDLDSSGTIAVTTTWYVIATGEAVESDAQYNTDYAWATNGSADAMDVQNIAAHELGHTWGLDHPSGPSRKIGCLTMYAFASLGETQKRTLGDGDIVGLQAIYGA